MERHKDGKRERKGVFSVPSLPLAVKSNSQRRFGRESFVVNKVLLLRSFGRAECAKERPEKSHRGGRRMVVTFFRHGSNIWLALGLVALVAGFVAGALAFSLFWTAIGALTFYVSEYGLHRFSFHAEPSRFAFVRKLQHRLHYDHHAEPGRLDLLFLPIWFLGPNLAITALSYALIFGWATVGSAMFGVLLATFHYEWVHYVAHIPYQPRTRVGRWIKQYHLRHHFISEKFWFGVSNPSMDLIGRTFEGARDVERSGTTRKLYG
jgi:4-hydroxysphinganine ceramide fatty acyl 2-hydroxylase